MKYQVEITCVQSESIQQLENLAANEFKMQACEESGGDGLGEEEVQAYKSKVGGA